MTMKLLFLALFLGSAAAADITASSALGRRLLSQATIDTSDSDRELTETSRELNDGSDYSFLADYSIKFQGCHHVQQWNDDADEENDVRIMTKRLARFRLCPVDQCSNEKSAGCTSKYGDYIVDMDTFVQAYLSAMEADQDTFCSQVSGDCQNSCGGSDDSDCTYSCYQGYSAEFCLDSDNDNDFDARDYAECQEFNFNNNGRSLEENNVQYYLGSYCADQGGEIRLGVFTDDTCTTCASSGESLFYSAMGFKLPYSSSSFISTYCMDCLYSDGNNNGNYQTKDVCSSTYAMSGKCETRMPIDYPNESSCNYIEGVKIIRSDGVIRTSTTKRSKAAAVAIGLFTTLSVLLAGYVFYLRTKLARAQINLAAASQTLM
jgi:hypothetical protein